MLQITSRSVGFVLHGSWGRNERPEYVDVWHEFSPETQRYVPERTCINELDGQYDGATFRCSECGYECEVSTPLTSAPFDSTTDWCCELPGYCPGCGAKVVER